MRRNTREGAQGRGKRMQKMAKKKEERAALLNTVTRVLIWSGVQTLHSPEEEDGKNMKLKRDEENMLRNPKKLEAHIRKMNERRSDLYYDMVDSREELEYPAGMEVSPEMEIARDSIGCAYDAMENWLAYDEIKMILESEEPPVIVSVILGGVVEVLSFAFCHKVLTALFLGICAVMAFFAVDAGAGYAQILDAALWLLAALYAVGLAASLTQVKTYAQMRRAVTSERAQYEKLRDKYFERYKQMMMGLNDLEEEGGIPADMMMSCDVIWRYFRDGKAKTMEQALSLYEKEYGREDAAGGGDTPQTQDASGGA